MIQLLGRKNSSNVQTVMIALDELGLPYQRHDIGGPFGKNKDPDYLARNPNGLVPLLNDGDVDVWESNAIIRYLAHRYGPTPLYPTEPAARSHVERWLDWRQTSFGPQIGQVFLAYIRTAPEARDLAALAKFEAGSISTITMLNAQLANNAFVAGPAFTLADIGLAIFVHRYFVLPIVAPRPELPHLWKWYEGLAARPAIMPHFALALT
jgi:glutathione S-transferase